MPELTLRQITQEDREINPKAVFFGEASEVVNPLAGYLSENNVDLFSGKSLHDAFFGDYFFYVGPFEGVKAFLAEKGSELPKTLLLLIGDSDAFSLSAEFKKYPELKVVFLGNEPFLSEGQPGKIIEFFFASSKQMMNLRTVRNGGVRKIAPQVVDTSVEKPVSSINDSSLSFTTEVVETSAKPVIEPSQRPLITKSEIVQDTPAQTVHTPKTEALEERPLITADLSKDSRTSTADVGALGNLFKTEIPKPTGQSSHKRLPIIFAAFLGFIFFLIFPFATLGVEMGVVVFSLKAAEKSLIKLDTKSSESQFERAVQFVNLSEGNLTLVSPFFSILGKDSTYQELLQLVSAEVSLGQGGVALSQAARDGQVIIGAVTGQNKGVAYSQLISSVKDNLAAADTTLAASQAEFKTGTLQNLFNQAPFSMVKAQVKNLPDTLQALRANLRSAQTLLGVSPELIGLNGEKNYLVLLQNNMELRPGGGFIGSFGVLSFADGRFKDFKIEDIYAADGSLQGHVDPPLPIKTYLGTEHWYMRDSNWSPDFSQSADKALWFLEKELGVTADGVIAIDVTFVQDLLRALGPVKVADLNQEVTADNFFTKAHTEIEKNFFPGSTEKKDYLGAVARSVVDELFHKNITLSGEFLNQITQGISQKHALFYFINPTLEAAMSRLNWGGGFATDACLVTCPPNTVGDFAMLVDANLGVNKSNFFLTRKIDTQIMLDSSHILHTLTVHYKNDSPLNEGKLGGSYKNYVRLFMPAGASVSGVKVDNLPLTLDSTAKVASSSNYIQSRDGNFAVAETLLEVPPQQSKTITYTYQTPNALLAKPASYQFVFEKEAGTLEDPLNLSVRAPGGWILSSNPSSSSTSVSSSGSDTPTVEKNGQITYNTSLSTTRELNITIK